MILSALAEYYDRRCAGSTAALAPFGFERKEIPFLIVLGPGGTFVDLEDTRQDEGRKKRGREFIVPQAVKRTVAVTPNLLWDNPGYVLGHDSKGNRERAKQQREAFGAAIAELPSAALEDDGIRAVLAFLTRGEFDPVLQHPVWTEVEASTNANLSFRLNGEPQLICQRPAVRRVVEMIAAGAGSGVDEEEGLCSVTGDRGRIARLHPSIKGVWGAQSSGANIVSFNLSAFNSYGRTQGYNAPIGERAVFAYTTALNDLLRSDSPQRLQVGDTSTVFWAERQHPMETAITAFFAEPPKDDPARNTEAVKALYGSPWSGRQPIEEDDTRFYVLGLAPNASRIAIRFWHVSTARELAGCFRKHFDDLRISCATFEPEVLPLWRLLAATAVQGKPENVRPNLAGVLMQSILSGGAYPRELLSAAVQRNRAEQDVTYARAALIKAWLSRDSRHTSPSPDLEVSVSLDRDNPNEAYRLGRLFAVLERVQEAASPGLNATIRERYFGAASTTPVVVFPRLLKLSNHHLSKLDSTGLRIFFEREIGQILGGISDFPSLLSLADQGRFSIGYYHQRQHFFTKKEPEQGAAA